MSTPEPPKTPGFKVQGIFYPDLDIEQWKNDAYTIARRMMYPASLADFLTYKCDVYLYNEIRAAVCMWHARYPALSVDEVITFVGGLRPDEIAPEGYRTVLVEDDAGPPEETGEPEASASSGNGKPSSEENQESSEAETSGTPLTPTGTEA